MAAAVVKVQWDPERSAALGVLEHRSLQVGLSRHVVRRYTDAWIRELRDVTPLARKLERLPARERRDLLPAERPYPVSSDVARRLGMRS